MTTGDKQRHLCYVLAHMELYAFLMGFSLVREDARRATSVHGKFGEKKSYAAAYSVHKLKLAQDYSIFKNGRYLQGKEADEAFNFLHDFVDRLGLAKRIKGDLGHFSMEHQGYR